MLTHLLQFQALISTPIFLLRGSKLALLSSRKFFPDETIDPISRLSGVGLRAFHEFVP
jgi:hypothetical protein